MASATGTMTRGVQLDVEDLLECARESSGLSDFGDPWFLRSLGKLVETINAEAGLTSIDATPVRQIIDALVDRLRLVRYLDRNPGIHDERIDVAGVIVGWPRGGSTLLHRLLASSPQLTAPSWWELRSPLPLDGETGDGPSPRQRLAIQAVEDLYEAWPRMRSMHPLKPLDADEEVMLFDRTFMSLMWPQYFYIPSYMDWLQGTDQSRAYEEVKLWLKALTFQQPKRRGRKWILKSPQHLLGHGIASAVKTFPGARLIMTHRSLQNVATSYSSMAETTLGGWSARMDLPKIGRDAIKLFGQSVDYLMEIRRDSAIDSRFIDVQFRETVEHPIETYCSVMEQMGLSVTEADLKAAEAWMAANGRETHPPHSYRPEDYGVTAAQIDRIFAAYHDAYLKR